MGGHTHVCAHKHVCASTVYMSMFEKRFGYFKEMFENYQRRLQRTSQKAFTQTQGPCCKGLLLTLPKIHCFYHCCFARLCQGPAACSDSPSSVVGRAQKRSLTAAQYRSDSLVHRQLLSMESEAENRS